MDPTAVLLRPAVYEHLYLAYNTSQDFLPQFEQSSRELGELMQNLPH